MAPADLFAWAEPPARQAPPPRAPEAPPPRAEAPIATAPAPLPSGAVRVAWPRTLPTEAHLADPAFRALFDAVRPWWISDDGGRSYGMSAAEHVLHLLAALRAAGAVAPPPVPYV